MKKVNNEQFLMKCKNIWGEMYSFDKVNYTNSRNKVTITCKVHGDFDVTPTNFISNKSGCPTCGGQKGLSRDEFILKAVKKHGVRYDYSKTNYTKAIEPVTITCTSHGDFEQLPYVHIAGSGCPKCAKVARLSRDEFILKAVKKHGVRYDYSKTNYTKAIEPVTITCTSHGDFEQLPHNHLRGSGCPKCGNNQRIKTKSLSLENAEKLCKKKHLSLVSYVGNAGQKSQVTCQNGHFFSMALSKIQQGVGCPVCAVPGYNPKKSGYVYILVSSCGNHMKIGLSNTPKKRIRSLSNSTPFGFRVVGWKKFSGSEAPKKEHEIHAKLISAALSGFDGCTEWFIRDDEVIRNIIPNR